MHTWLSSRNVQKAYNFLIAMHRRRIALKQKAALGGSGVGV